MSMVPARDPSLCPVCEQPRTGGCHVCPGPPARGLREEDARLLERVLHPARRHPVIELAKCQDYDELDLVIGDEYMTHVTHMTGQDLDALRVVLGVTRPGRERALACVRYLAALDPAVLAEALGAWRHESPDKAARLCQLLTGQARPRFGDLLEDTGRHDPDRGASYDRQ